MKDRLGCGVILALYLLTFLLLYYWKDIPL